MADAGLDADVLLDIRAALNQVGRMEAALDRASHVVVTADARAVTAAIDAAVQNADTGVAVMADAADVTRDIDAAVEAADSAVVVTGDAREVTGSINAAVETADTSVAVTGSVAPGLTQGVDNLGDSLDAAATSGINLGTILGGLSVAAAVAGLRQLADAASDLQESTSKAQVVFGAQFADIEEFAEGAAESTGLAKQEALEATATFGNLFQALGSTREEAAAMSPDVVQLAADLASFNNLGVDETLEKLRSGLVGEVEPLRSLGVSFLAADVAAKGLELGLAGANGEMTEGAKVQARLALIMEQTTLAQGDFARTSEGLANQQRILQAELGNAAAAAGTMLLPAFEALIAEGRDAIPGLLQLAENVLPALSSALIALAPLIGTTVDLLVALSPVVQVVANAIGLIPSPVIEVVAVLFTLNRAIKLVNTTITSSALTRLPQILANAAVPTGALSGAFSGALPNATKLSTSLRGLTTGMSGATLAAGLGFTAFSMYSDVMASAKAQGEEFGRTIREDVGDLGTKSMAELNDLTAVLDQEITNMKGNIDDSFLGRNGVNRDFNAALNEGINQMEQLSAEAEAAKRALRLEELNAQYLPLIESLRDTHEAMGDLRDEAPEVGNAIGALRQGAVEPSEGAFLDLALSMHEAELSEEAMANAAALLGTDVESLTAIVEQAGAELDRFVDTAAGALPTLGDAFQNVGKDGVLSVNEFLWSLRVATYGIATFRSDLARLAEAGFADIAGIIAEQGPEVGGALAGELVAALDKGNVEVLETVREATVGFNNEWQNTVAFFREVIGPQMILQAGLLGEGLTNAFASELTFKERIHLASQLAKSGLSQEGQAIAAIAATEGADAARAYGNALDLDAKTVNEAIKAGTAMARNAPTGAARTAGSATGDAFGAGMVAGLGKYAGAVADKAKALVLIARAEAARAAREGSPSKLFAELGANMALGVAQGIEEQVAEVNAAAAALVQGAASAAADVVPPSVELAAVVRNGQSSESAARTLVVVESGAIRVEVTGELDELQAVALGEGIADGLAERLAERGLAVQSRAQ